MIWFAAVAWTLFGTVVVVLAALSVRFASHYRQPMAGISDDQLPAVGVLMTLRGADPFLEKCLRQLFCIDYPRHQICIIVDSDLDPAYALVNKISDELDASHVGIEILTEHGENCSLRMSALNQGVEGFSDDVEIIAWLDADATPYPGWLRDLVAPFADAKVGAACGYRWFVPPDRKPGSLVRYLWNAASITQMRFFQIGWGGSYAIRRSVFNELEIGKKWQQVLFEDTFTTNEVLKGGYEFRFVPGVTMDNHESTDLSGCVRFLSRQLLNCRLYHRAWPKVSLLALLTLLPIPINVALPVVAAWFGEWVLVGWSAVAWAVYGLRLGLFNTQVESHVRQRLEERGVESAHFSLHAIWTAPLTSIVYAVALWNSIRQREVNWRGIRYQFQSGTDVRRLNYEPFVPEPV